MKKQFRICGIFLMAGREKSLPAVFPQGIKNF
jgi:hypothetical protein